nr:V-type ATP synthase subunit I [Methanotorris formicicus]
MRPARMNKIRAVILDEKMDSVIRNLHESGLVELYDMSAKLESPEWRAFLSPATSAEYTRQIATLMIKVGRILDLFKNVKEEGKSSIKELLNPQPPKKKRMSFSSAEEAISYAEKVLSDVDKEVSEPSAKLTKLENRKTELNLLKEQIKYLQDFDIDLRHLGVGEFVYIVSGLTSKEKLNELEKSLDDVTDGYCEIVKGNVVVGEEGEKVPVIIAVLKEYMDSVGAELRKLGFERFDISNVEGTPKELLSNIEKELSNITSEIENTTSQLRKLAEKWEEELLAVYEVLEIEKERGDAFSLCGRTERTYVLEAWVPQKYAGKAKEIIENAADGYAVVEIAEPDEPEEKIPVLLDNPKAIKPFEMLTEMFAPPKYNEVDPTLLIVPGFLMFYGIMLTDAVYGFLLTLTGLFLWKKMGKVSEGAYNLGYILTLAGIATVIAGLVTGGYLGDFLYQFLGFDIYKAGVALVNPLGESAYISEANPLFNMGNISVNNGPMAILIFSIVVGILHLFIGLLVGFLENIKRGNQKDAILNQGIWLFLILAIVVGVAIGNLTIIGVAFVLVMLVCMIKGFMNGGIMDALLGAMDITGFLGNVLSYARLLALCLATGGLAMAVNIMSKLLQDSVPVVGIVLAILMLLLGHTFNFVMNGLGSFIHSLRLHYVEFFGQFYEGGGKKFSPFKAKREFTTP